MRLRSAVAVAIAAAGGAETLRQTVELCAGSATRPWLSSLHAASHAPAVAVVPARDEADVIGGCVASLLAQDPPLRGVIVVDDGSTDDTATIARDAARRADGDVDERLVVVTTQELRPGWVGKPAACQAGADAAAVRFPDAAAVVFVDADVTLHPAAVGALLGAADSHGVDAVSLLGRFDGGDTGVRLLLPDVGVAIMTSEGNPRRVNDPLHPAAVASGQCFVIARRAYDAIGGHAAVAGEVLEDCALAARLQEAGYRHRLLLGAGLMRVRMYETTPELWNGFAKNLAGMRGTRGRDVAAELWRRLAPLWLPIVAWLLDRNGPGGAVAVRAVVAAFNARLVARVVALADPHLAVLAPVSDALHAGIYLDSVRRWRKGSVQWKGRLLTVQPGPSRARSRFVRPAPDSAVPAA